MLQKIGKVFPKVLVTTLFTYTLYVTVFLRTTDDGEKHFGVSSWVLVVLYAISIFIYYRILRVGPGFARDYKDALTTPFDHQTSQMYGQDMSVPTTRPKPQLLVEHSIKLKPPFCSKCQLWKPDRCHHCSSCGECVLKMDHHCPWFALCVGYKNQKYFVQFSVYTTLYAIEVLVLNSMYLYHWFSDSGYSTEYINLQILITWFLALIISLSMLIFTGFIFYLISENMTTIEQMERNEIKHENELILESRGVTNNNNHNNNNNNRADSSNFYHQPPKNLNVYDLGSRWENIKSVMGSSVAEMLLPITNNAVWASRHTLNEQGLWFPVNDSYKKDIELQQRLLHRLGSG
ncbi:hypothetical protein ACO0QE_000348 [Hanseniaspora vineae]